ncbi:transaldolase family protein [Kineococcus sp. DHX-1]|uniref:transaldolase family protein n=1 Tax=Kineococcus sp. DHX-1 TaxID=3349638 RepID=UPI0036D28742
MRFYADSADVERVEALLRAGLVSGVTSNPAILDRADRGAGDFPELYSRYVDAGAEEVFFQTWGSDAPEMVRNASRITGLGDRVVVKLTATRAGFSAAAALHRAGVPTLVTAVNTVAQAAVAAQVGATWIAPYFGQIADRTGAPPVELVGAMHAALRDTPTQVLLASVRSPLAVEQALAVGITAFTAHPDVLDACLTDENTERAHATFEELMLRRA